MAQEHPKFSEALLKLDSGDSNGLKSLLETHPELIKEVSYSEDGCYAGYFYRPTLLHHVAGNPTRGPIPDNIIELTKLLLELGADVDATCGGGPTQPNSGGGTVLGLAASGAALQEAGHSGAMLDLLLDHRATMDFVGDGGLMWISIYHTVENIQQTEVARHLAKRGHEVDLCFAAALGMKEKVQNFLSSESLSENAYRYYKHHCPEPATSDAEIIQDAFLSACIAGEQEIAKLLLSRGADLNAFRPWGPRERVTPLHGAAWAGQTEMVKYLLSLGADASLKDRNHHSTPVEWARHCGRRETESAFGVLE